MPQTTNQVPFACGQLEVGTDGVNWTDISGEAQSLSSPEATRIVGEAYTLEGDSALVAAGKRQPIEVSAVIIYTEVDAEAYQVIRNIFEAGVCGGSFYLRWSPKGGSAGDERLTTGEGVLTSFTYPPMDATSGAPIVTGFTVRFGTVTTAVIAS